MTRFTIRTWVGGLLLAAGCAFAADSADAGNVYFNQRRYDIYPPQYGAYGPDYAPPRSIYDPAPIPGPNPAMGAMYQNPAYFSYGQANESWFYTPNHSRYDYGVNYLGGRGYQYHYKRDWNCYRVRESFGR